MSVSIADFRARFSEFTNVTTYPDARIQIFIDDAYALVNTSCPNADMMIVYLTAHLLILGDITANGDTSTIKGVASESVGDVSVNYGSGTGTAQDDYYKTAYGQRYLDLRKNCIGRPIIG